MERNLLLRAESPNKANSGNKLRRFSKTSPLLEAMQRNMDEDFPMRTKLDSNQDYCQFKGEFAVCRTCLKSL